MRLRIASLFAVLLAPAAALAQAPAGPPPAVGVVRAKLAPVTESDTFVGRIEATDRVNLVARVTGFLEKRLFTEGAEVKQGDLLYTLEKPPFEADVQAKAAAIAQAQAQLENAQLTLQRAEALLHTPAGQQSNVDNARATQLSDQAMLLQAQANLRASEINLGYTDIRAPIAGKIGQTAVTVGNVVSPNSGTLATIVSQDPMYVVFPIAYRTALDLRDRYAKQGFSAVVLKVQLPDGRVYGERGKLDFVNNTISANTDTILLRGTIPNPPLPVAAGVAARELTDGEFVNVIVEGVQPVEALTIPRAAVLSDQSGDFVYVVDAQNKIEQRHIQLGQSTPTTAVVMTGLKDGEMVVLEGLQKVRPGQAVTPGPATPPPAIPPTAMQGGGPSSSGATR
ncbi:MAG: efflux RND transporter periplasmic adaptor subunit [Alphaproteobacteria bacterium]|nr:efflux RND transporter periplasmic adaptor subunit [Alphaproteobacteria bacterium]